MGRVESTSLWAGLFQADLVQLEQLIPLGFDNSSLLDSGPNVLRLLQGLINIGLAGSIFLGCNEHRSSFDFYRNVLQIAMWGGF